MANLKPPVLQTAVSAWSDAFRAIVAMPVMAGVAFAILAALSLFSVAITPAPIELVGNHWFPLYTIAVSIVDAVFLAPLAIAVHRFVLLGETTSGYPFDPASRRFQRFVGFAILVKLLWLIPTTIQSMVALSGKADAYTAAGVAFVVFILEIVFSIIVLRRAILFPAIALDRPGATWSRAARDTKGSSWRVAFIFLLTTVPIMIIGVVLYMFMLNPLAMLDKSTQMILAAVNSVIEAPALCAYAAAASHIFRARADLLNRPELPGAAEFQASRG